mmetsp:Transcript_6840/g.16993  ORF Transcript_6840/g.16993 Transcript_6840/m.16993 type:complete len:273 (+) Transcript_6840:215-1033(+)
MVAGAPTPWIFARRPPLLPSPPWCSMRAYSARNLSGNVFSRNRMTKMQAASGGTASRAASAASFSRAIAAPARHTCESALRKSRLLESRDAALYAGTTDTVAPPAPRVMPTRRVAALAPELPLPPMPMPLPRAAAAPVRELTPPPQPAANARSRSAAARACLSAAATARLRSPTAAGPIAAVTDACPSPRAPEGMPRAAAFSSNSVPRSIHIASPFLAAPRTSECGCGGGARANCGGGGTYTCTLWSSSRYSISAAASSAPAAAAAAWSSSP